MAFFICPYVLPGGGGGRLYRSNGVLVGCAFVCRFSHPQHLQLKVPKLEVTRKSLAGDSGKSQPRRGGNTRTDETASYVYVNLDLAFIKRLAGDQHLTWFKATLTAGQRRNQSIITGIFLGETRDEGPGDNWNHIRRATRHLENQVHQLPDSSWAERETGGLQIGSYPEPPGGGF